MDAPPTGITTQGHAACAIGSHSDHALISKYIGVVHVDAPRTTLGSSSASTEEDYYEELDALLCSFNEDNTRSSTLQAAGALHRFQYLKTSLAAFSTEPVVDQHCWASHHPASHHDKASNTPSPHNIHPPPQALYPDLNAHVFGVASCPAVSNSMFGTDLSGRSPADDNFSAPYLEINQKNQVLPADLYADRYKLTCPIPTPCHNSPISVLQPTADVPTSDVDDHGGGRAQCFLAFKKSASFRPASTSDSATTVFSTQSDQPIMQPNNRMPQPGLGNLSMPPSPPLSANKAKGHPSTSKKRRRRSSGAAAAAGHVVGFKVKSKSADLDDGYRWLKYGEKMIQNDKYTRSYFHCDKKADRCEVLKHMLKRSDDDEFFEVIYLGRHNHLPDEQNALATRKRDRRAARKRG